MKPDCAVGLLLVSSVAALTPIFVILVILPASV